MAEPVNRRDLPGGGKYYQHPLTDEKFDSVTTVLDTWDKSGLKIWVGSVTADMAMDSMPQIMQALITPDCGNTFNRCYQKHGRENRCERCPCGDCGRCWWRRLQWRHAAESSRRAQEGTECHEAINHWVLSGGETVSMRDEVKPYFQTFLQFVKDYGLVPFLAHQHGSWEQTEATLINRQHGYAGTSDAAIWLTRGPAACNKILDLAGKDRVLVRVDYKTREKVEESLYNDMVLQGVAYEYCDTVLLSDGQELPAPQTDLRAVLQLRPATIDGAPNPDPYSFKPMVSGPLEFNAFLGLLTAYRWLQAKGGKTAFDPAIVFPQPYPFDQSGLATEDTSNPHGVTPSLLDPVADAAGVAAPAKKAAKKAAPRKAASATANQDAFALAGASKPASWTRPGGASAWPAGQPDTATFEEEIPF